MKNLVIVLCLGLLIASIGCGEDFLDEEKEREFVLYGVQMFNDDAIFLDTIADSTTAVNWPHSHGIQLRASNNYCEVSPDCKTEVIGLKILNYSPKVFCDTVLVRWTSGYSSGIEMNKKVDSSGMIYITPPFSDTSYFNNYLPIKIKFWPRPRTPELHDVQPDMGYDISIFPR